MTRRADVALVVEHEVAVVAPRREQTLLEPGPLDPLEPLGGDDLIGVDVGPLQRQPCAGDHVHGLHAQLLRRGEVAGDGGGGGDGGGDEVGAAAAALAALEVAVARARRPLAGSQLVGVHRQAHRASRLAPVGAGGREHPVETLRLGLRPHGVAAGHDHHPLGGDVAAVEHGRRSPQVLDAAVRARPDEHGVDGDVADRRAGDQPHVLERPHGRSRVPTDRRRRPARARVPSIDVT